MDRVSKALFFRFKQWEVLERRGIKWCWSVKI